MKKIRVNSRKKKKREHFKPVSFAHQMLLEAGIEDGTIAYTKYVNGKLVVRFNKKDN